MRLLLDTQAAILFGTAAPALPAAARSAIEDPENVIHLSAVSIWEMAIKRALGKLELQVPAIEIGRRLVEGNGFRPLEITFEHAGAVEGLPPVHRDPFDRLLAAQALFEGLRIVSGDTVFDRYAVERIWG